MNIFDHIVSYPPKYEEGNPKSERYYRALMDVCGHVVYEAIRDTKISELKENKTVFIPAGHVKR